MLFLSHFMGWYYIDQVKLVELCSASECFYAVQLFFTKVSSFSKTVNSNPAKMSFQVHLFTVDKKRFSHNLEKKAS